MPQHRRALQFISKPGKALDVGCGSSGRIIDLLMEWMPTKAYDFISAWDSVWHVPLASQEAVWTKLLCSLAPGGVMILTRHR